MRITQRCDVCQDIVSAGSLEYYEVNGMRKLVCVSCVIKNSGKWKRCVIGNKAQ